MGEIPPFEQFPGLRECLAGTAPVVGVRANPLKGVAPPTTGAVAVPWEPTGWSLPDGQQRPRFTFDPCLHQGLYYPQEPSSMIVGEVARRIVAAEGADKALRWLDACAAPGGKTTAIATALPAGSAMVANEKARARAAVLAENVSKWGLSNVAVTCADAASYGSRLPGVFDVISADVPCSGEGMMRRDPQAVAQWSPSLVRECGRTQRDILRGLWDALRPGGWLVYSTCTFNAHEDEEAMAMMVHELGAVPVDLGLAEDYPGLVPGGLGGVHLLPTRVRGEGLYVGVVRKDADAPAGRPYKAGRGPSPAKLPRDIAAWVDLPAGLDVFSGPAGEPCAFPIAHAGLASALPGLLQLGTPLGVPKGRGWTPTQALALSAGGLLRPGAFPAVEVDYATAMAMLRREGLPGWPQAPKGMVLLTYGARPLGWANNLGNRANNPYPADWRVLSGHAPAEPPRVVITLPQSPS